MNNPTLEEQMKEQLKRLFDETGGKYKTQITFAVDSGLGAFKVTDPNSYAFYAKIETPIEAADYFSIPGFGPTCESAVNNALAAWNKRREKEGKALEEKAARYGFKLVPVEGE